MDFSNKQLLLAPMAGVNDPVFRAICRRMGACLTYTEMVSSKGLSYKNSKTQEMIAGLPEDKPYVVQLFGKEPEVMAAEARGLQERLGKDIAYLDINMGCPARKVASAGNGAALLQTPEVAAEIVQAVSSAITLPLTVKMRLLSENEGMADTLAFAKLMACSGAAAITLHGRTAAQFYTGIANKDAVATLARHLDVPVIASGDVFSYEDMQEYLQSGASAVMAARGARGNPWIFANHAPSLEEIVSMAKEHTQRLYDWEPRKLVWMRKHLAWYFKGTPSAVRIRTAVQKAVALEDYLAILDGSV